MFGDSDADEPTVLERIILPAMLQDIKSFALACPKLKEIVFFGKPPRVFYYAFKDCPQDMVIRYPVQYESEWAKNGAKTWNGF